MIFLLPTNQIKPQNIQFTEKKKNMIIDGTFSKIIHTTNFYMSGGIYLYCRILVITPPGLDVRIRMPTDHSVRGTYDDIINRWENDSKAGDNVLPMYPYKTMYKFDPNTEDNRETVVNLCIIEEQILEYYKLMHNVDKTCVYNLKSALLNGNIKIHEDGTGNSAIPPAFNEYSLKISGVWETKMNVGITFKFMYIRETY